MIKGINISINDKLHLFFIFFSFTFVEPKTKNQLYMKNIKFKSIISIAIICYVVFIASYFVNEWEDFKLGFFRGYNSDSLEQPDEIGGETYFITVAPKESVFSFPEKIQNIRFNKEVNLRYHKMKVISPSTLQLNQRNKIYKRIFSFLSLVVFAVFIFIPVQFYRLMKTIQKEIFFDLKNKKRFNDIAIALLIAFWSIFIANYLYFKIINSLFEFEDYVIIKDQPNYILILLCLVSMIVAETISRGIKMKDEQELTI